MSHRNLTEFRLKLSDEAVQTVELLLKNGKYRAAVNRMYFAISYKALALADQKNFYSSDYKQLKLWLEKTFVDKKHLFDSDILIFSQIFQQSQELDHADFSEITESVAAGLFTKMKLLLGKLDKFIVAIDESAKEDAIETIVTEKILVPWDFSPVAENALEHAIQFAEITGGYITLVHLVKKQKEVAGALKKLTDVAESAKSKFEKISEVVVREGNIFDSINDIAVEMNAKMVIMGTHGITGMQKFTGSKALKVIAGTQIPFVVIQDKPTHEHIKDIILPIDDRKEIRQKMNQVKFISKLYNVKFHLCVAMASPLDVIKKKIKNNLIFVQSYMKQYKIAYELHEFPAIKDIVGAVSTLSQQINPDLILIITTKDIAATDYLVGANEQKIIANEHKIPVMCISPVKGKGYSYSSGTR